MAEHTTAPPAHESRWAELQANLRRMAGMPDYAAFVRARRREDPTGPVPSEAEYFDDFVRARYERPSIRCC